MLGICTNGHMTGSRRCGLCGADRESWAPGNGAVAVAKHAIVKGPIEHPDRLLRRETRVGSGPLGPNTIRNVSYAN